MKFGNVLNVSIKRSEIDICHGMANNNSDQPKPIIVRFRPFNAKRDLYAACKHLEVLIPVSALKGQRKYISTWSIDGKLFIKKSQNGKLILINCLEDLDMIFSWYEPRMSSYNMLYPRCFCI